MSALRPIIIAAALLLLTLPHARAATLSVPSEYPTIQAGIDAAAPGDTVLVDDGTYTGPGNVDLDFGGKSLTVTSVNGASKTIIDCGGYSSTDGSGNHRGFYIHSGTSNITIAISGFAVKNGYESDSNSSSPDSGYGGAIYNGVYNNGTVSVANCTFSANSASEGDGIYNGIGGSNSMISVAHCTFSGDGILNEYGGSNGAISVNDCAFSGSGISNSDNGSGNGTISITNCYVSGGNGIKNLDYGSGTISVADCVMSGNGHGLYNEDYNANGTISVTNCVISGGSATYGGGIYNFNYGSGNTGIISVTNCTISGNTAQSGGGIFNDGTGNGTTLLTNDIVYGNTGGEISGGNITVNHCDVQGGFAGTGNINADPLFVDAASGDLHLQPGSPCFGAGTSQGAPTTDKDGNPRPNPPSIGAYDRARFDFNQDGRPDLLWHNSRTGQTLTWDMNDQSVTHYGSPFATVSNTAWTVAAVADVNGDGHPDLLWQNRATGDVLFWLMGGSDGTQVISYGSPFATVADTHWRVVSMADMNNDGSPDMLWENSATGQLVIWYLNGTSVIKYGSPFAQVTNTSWQVAGAADFNGDGHPDLLWENSQTGDVLVWNLGGGDGTTVTNYGSPFVTVANTAWHIVGTGDLDGDGHPDLVWQNTQTGDVLRWRMGGADGQQVLAYGSPFATVTDTHWQIVGVH